jgi:asparagine synthase (glutamine-hydrolysing)
MSLNDGRLQLTYNGEIYNYLELRRTLIDLGRTFRTGTDTEVLLHAYDEWGDNCLERLNGMWAFAIWDRTKRRLFASVDISGIKPFYYTTSANAFLFASEIKALICERGNRRRANAGVVALYLGAGIDQIDDQTFFEDVKRLPGGHALTLEPGKAPRVWRWWKPQPLEPVPTDDEAVSYLREALRDSIRLRYRSDVPVGVMLSGGVDSSTIACFAADMAARGDLTLPHGLRTYTVGVDEPRLDETGAAAEVARHCKAQAFATRLSPENCVADVHDVIRQHDEPVRTCSIFMQYQLMRLVRETGTVVTLSGQGPDELLWGYPWQYPYAWSDLLLRGQPLSAAREILAAVARATVGPLSLAGYSVDAFVPAARRLRYAVRMSPFVSKTLWSRPRALLFERSMEAVNARGHFLREVESTGLPSLLRYEDRNSMAFSVESRLPYLDPRIINLAYTLRADQRIHRGWSKWLLRRAASGTVPHSVAWKRHKLGFGAPEGRVMTSFIPLFRELFSGNVRSSDVLRPQAILRALERAPTPPAHFWRFLNLELWMRQVEVTN